MRCFLAGLFALVMLSCGAMAQVSGFVESVGLGSGGGGVIRPDRWTPMRVNLTSHVSTPEKYQIQVWQDDLDKDRVVYTKDITLSPQSQEKFDVYFIFQPSEDLRQEVLNAGTLQRILQVRVCLPVAEGKRPDEAKVVIERLSIKFPVDNIDPAGDHLGSRLVLCVADYNSRTGLESYQHVPGLAETVDAVTLRPADLGDNVLFYNSVDTVIWLGANADDLSAAGSLRRDALEQFVREGGRLIVCEPPPADMHKIEGLGSMLPIELKDAGGNWLVDFPMDAVKKTLVDALPKDAKSPPVDALPWLAQNEGKNLYPSRWHEINSDDKHPIFIAHAQKLKPDAMVAVWQNAPAKQRWPYVVRGAVGLGSVTWVAQDLGDPNLHGPESDNWPHVWDHVIGWHNDTFTARDSGFNQDVLAEQKKARANAGGLVDFSQWMLQRTDHEGRGAAYIFVAVLFFIAYWIAAGPGTYLFLSRRKRKELNWFVFGAWAFVGTALTVGVVRLLLHGGAQAKHLTIVRQRIGEAAQIYSRVGLYIPRDGEQTLTLENTAHDAISYITPLQKHPEYVESTNFPAAQVYAIPVHDDPQPVNVRIPYRSTLKKLQMRWVGGMKDGVDASAIRLTPSDGDKGVIFGKVKNQTGNDLKNIYFVFRYAQDGVQEDKVLFIQTWHKDDTVDLNAEYGSAVFIGDNDGGKNKKFAYPRDERNSSPIKGNMSGSGWNRYWTDGWGKGSLTGDTRGTGDFNPTGAGVSNAIPILSLFDLIVPARNPASNNEEPTRVDFLRRGGSVLNMSQAVAAGRLVILAQSASDDEAIPFPLAVDSSRVQGQGRVVYQFSLPLDRTGMEKK